MNLSATAGLAGLSPAYLSMIERGQRPVTKRSVLESLAHALRVSPAELTGRPYAPSDEASAESHFAMSTLADVLGGWWVGEVPDIAGRPLPEVLADLHRLNAELRPSSDYAAQAEVLPRLIRDLLAAAADPRTGREALVPLLIAYHAAGALATRLGFPGLPALAADRMGRVAEKHETRGMANLTAAMASAAQGRADLAETHLAEAAAIAELIEPDVSPWATSSDELRSHQRRDLAGRDRR